MRHTLRHRPSRPPLRRLCLAALACLAVGRLPADDLAQLEKRFNNPKIKRNWHERNKIAAAYVKAAAAGNQIRQATAFLARHQHPIDDDSAALIIKHLKPLPRQAADYAWLNYFFRRDFVAWKPVDRMITELEKMTPTSMRQNLLLALSQAALHQDDWRRAVVRQRLLTLCSKYDLWVSLVAYLQQEEVDVLAGKDFTKFVNGLKADQTKSLLAAIDQAIATDPRPGVERKRVLARHFLDRARKNSDTVALNTFLQKHANVLRRAMPTQFTKWEINAAVSDGDRERARSLLASLLEQDEAFAKTDEYRELEKRIFTMKQKYGMPLQIDLEMPMIEQRYQGYQNSGNATGIHRLIRDTLAKRGSYAVRDEKDQMLYPGVKNVYRGIFKTHAGDYPTFLREHFNRLQAAGLIDAASKAEELRHLSLKQPGRVDAVVPATGRTDVLRRLNHRRFVPCVSLPTGLFEQRAAYTRRQLGGRREDLLPGIDGARTYWQTSQAIACLEGSRVVWSWSCPLESWGKPGDGQKSWEIRRRFGSIGRPAVLGRLVLARLASAAGLVLAALDKADGELAWIAETKGFQLTSPPAVWQNHVVLLARDEDNITNLLIIDDKGRIQTRMGLTQKDGTTYFGLKHGGILVDFTANVPPPHIVGDVAFIQQVDGCVAAINLADAAIMWIRAYPRESKLELVRRRRSSTPIVLSRTVILAPADSRQVMALDRHTGRVRARSTALLWDQIHQAGPATVAVLRDDEAAFIRPADLKPISRVKLRRPRFIERGKDGCVIADDTGLYIFAADGKRKARSKLDPTATLLAVAGDRFVGARRDQPQVVGVFSATAKTEVKTVKTVPGGRLTAHNVVKLDTGTLLCSDNLIAFFNAAGRRTWEQQVRSEDKVTPLGNYVLLQQGDILTVLDSAAGQQVRRWPQAGSGTTVAHVREGPDAAYIAAHEEDYRRDYAVYRLSPQLELRRLGHFFHKFWRDTIFTANGEYAYSFDRKRTNVHILKFNPRLPKKRGKKTTGHYAGYELVRTARAPHQIFQTFIPNGRSGVLFFHRDTGNCMRIQGRQITPFKLNLENGLEARPPYLRIIRDRTNLTFIYEKRVRRKKTSQYITYLDTKQLKSWRNKRPDNVLAFAVLDGGYHEIRLERPRRQPAVIKTIFFDLRKTPDLANANIHRDDLDLMADDDTDSDAAAAISTVTIRESTSKPPPDLGDLAGTIKLDGKIYYLMGGLSHYKGVRTRPQAYAVVQTKHTAKHQTIPVPFLTQADNLSEDLLLIDDRVVSAQAFKQALNLSQTVLTVTGTADRKPPTVDGYLDEWTPAEFVKTTGGEVALRRQGKRLWVAFRLTRPELIKEIARAGLQGNVTVVAGPGAKLGWAQDLKDPTDWRVQKMMTQLKRFAPTPQQLAGAVTPDAAACTGELVVECSDVTTRSDGSATPPAAAFAGDFAFRLLWRTSVLTPERNLLETELSGPFSYTRLRFGEKQ